GAPDKLDHSRYGLVGVKDLRFQRLLPGESKKPLSQRRRALSAVIRVFNCSRNPLSRVLVQAHKCSLRNLQIPRHHGEQVIEVVAYASSQLTYPLHLLGVTEHGLGITPLFRLRLEHRMCQSQLPRRGHTQQLWY